MATALDIAKLNSNAAPLAATDAARHAGIEKMAELVVPARVPGKISLVGLTRAELAQRLAEMGVPEGELKMRVAQLWHWIYLRGAQSFDAMSNVGKGLRAQPRGSLYARSAAGRLRAGVEGRHPQVADPDGLDRPPRQGRRDRVRLHPRGRPRHVVRVEPGRLHAHLLLLPHGHAAPGAQPDLGRDRGAARGRPRPASATGRARRRPRAPSCRPTAAASSRTSSSWAWASRSTTSTA